MLPSDSIEEIGHSEKTASRMSLFFESFRCVFPYSPGETSSFILRGGTIPSSRLFMTIDRIDWLRLKPYKRDSRESFEHICYQIARELYSDRGVFTPIDDSGGGSGVEFFLELHNGDIWGWQAKFYPGQGQRLTPNRRRKIQLSLRLTKKQYGNRLKRWFLCTPIDLQPKETTMNSSGSKISCP